MLQEPIFLSLLRGTQPPLPSLTTPSSSYPPAGVCHPCNVDGHLLPPPPFPPRERVRPCNVDQPPLSNPPLRRERARLCNVGRHLLTSFSPPSFSPQLRRNRRTTQPARGGKRPPFANRGATLPRLAPRGEPITAKARHPLPLRLP
jgi:hypothetical protein